MKIFGWKSRKYPIKYDEYGRSARQQAFELFDQKYRPAQIYREELLPVKRNTLYRYFEVWKKERYKVSHATFKKFMREHPEFTEDYIKTLADYFEVTPEFITIRMQKPWGIEQLTSAKLPDNKLARIQSEKEVRLEAALRLIYLGEQFFKNSPDQVKQLIYDIVTLKDNTRLVIQKGGGRVLVRKEKLILKHGYR